jgi:integrase/recombinase XerD
MRKKKMAFVLVQQQFETYLNESGLSPPTVKSYLRDTAAFLQWLAIRQSADSRWPVVTAADVEAYKQHLTLQSKRSPASINRMLQSLRKFDHFMISILDHDRRPAREVPLVDLPAPEAPEILTAAQEAALLHEIKRRNSNKGVRDGAIVYLLLRTGIRAKELVQLRGQDVHLGELSGDLIISAADASQINSRMLPLDLPTCAAVEAYLDGQPALGNDLVFTGQKASPLSVRAVQQILTNISKQVGFPLSAKLLRDTYARALWRETGDIHLLCTRMGYKHLQTAVRHLLHEKPEIDVKLS